MIAFENDQNEGRAKSHDLTGVLGRVRAGSNINQIRGINVAGSTGSGIPKHVTDVGASMANASTGATSTLTVTFRRDPADSAYQGVIVWVKGYQANQSPTQVASSADSPVNFILNNTAEALSILVQAYGNGGSAPLSTAPTVGVTLPKSTAGGVGTTTTTTSNPVSGSASAGQLAKFATPATTLTGADLTGDVVTSGSVATTVQKIQGFAVSSNTPKIGDVFEWSGTQWVPSTYRFSVRGWRVPVNSTAIGSCHAIGGLVPTGSSTNTGNNPSATEPRLLTMKTAATAETVCRGCEEQINPNGTTLGIFNKFTARIRGDFTANVRYWIGLGLSTVGNLSGTAFFATDTPNTSYIAFRYSDSTDSTWKAICGTATASQTVVDTGVSVDTTNTQLFEITWDGTNANFYINGTRVAQISTNVPATSSALRAMLLVDNKNTANQVSHSHAHCFVWEKL